VAGPIGGQVSEVSRAVSLAYLQLRVVMNRPMSPADLLPEYARPVREERGKHPQGYYAALLKEGRARGSPYDKQIVKDIHRTLPNQPLFQSDEGMCCGMVIHSGLCSGYQLNVACDCWQAERCCGEC